MTSPAAVALSRLLPTLKPIPPRLLDTADSLLALSRQRAPNLKGDEEIARAHACAEIACDRLREKLRLPPVKTGTAPASAKVYKKLVGFLERSLEDDVIRLTTTPGKRKREQQPEPVTPSKRAKTTSTANTPTKTPSSFVGKIKASKRKSAQQDSEAPSFAMSAVRTLCKAFSTPEMAPHVYTGTCVVLKLAALYPRPSLEEATEEDLEITDEMFEANVTALVVGLYLMVLTRMMHAKMTSKLFKSISSKSVEILERLEDAKSIEAWVKRVNKEGYAKGQDWWKTVPESVFEFGIDQVEHAGIDEAMGNEAGDEQAERAVRRDELNLEPDPEGVLLPGLGTMMQDAVDWMSEDQKNEYVEWKKEIMERLEQLSPVNGTVAVH